MPSDLDLKTIYTNDINVAIEVDCETDVSSASELKILIQDESNNITQHDAIIVPGETDKIKFNVASDDLTSSGVYKVRAYVDFGGGHIQQGKVDYLRVKDSWTVT